MNQKGLNPMIQFNVRIDAELKESLQEIAEKQRRSLSEMVRIILEEYAIAHKNDNPVPRL